MIDDENEAHELIEALKQHLPMRAFATYPLVKALGPKCKIQKDDVLQIDSALYLGDEGGVACSIGLGGDKVAVVSITHLRADAAHPLASRIQAYQSRRSQRLGALANLAQTKSHSGSTTEVKGRKARATPKRTGKKNHLTSRFQEARESWIFGEFQTAAEAFREVFSGDRKDPFFSRYWLASSLFQSGSWDELDKLLQEQDDNSGVWRFAQALNAFRQRGDSEVAQRLLIEADYLEPGFEDYLLRDKVFDGSRPVQFDGDDGARAYGCARLFLPAWRAVPGAATWARRILKVPTSSIDAVDTQQRDPREELQALPLLRETWQVGMMQHPIASNDNGEPLWLFGVANVDGLEVRALTVIDRPLTEPVVWNELIRAFLSPLDGEPARPSTLVVSHRDFSNAWKPLLSDIGVRCIYKRKPQPVSQMLEAMAEKIEMDELPPAEGVDIRAFPQTDAVWQADFTRSPGWVEDERQGPYRPWMMHALEKSKSITLAILNAPGEPTPEMLREFLIRTMARPNGEPAQRPRSIEVSNSDCYEYLRPWLEAAGVGCRLVDELVELNESCLRLARSFDGPEKPSQADGPGVTRAHLKSFYEAAAYYFRQAPWKRVPGEVPIEVRCNDLHMGTRYAIVLGRTGVQLGLCIYDNWETVREMLAGFGSPEGNRALAVCYDEPQIVSAVDLQMIEVLGWPIAAPEAWPVAMRAEPGRSPRSVNAEELAFLDACLRAIPEFLKQGKTSQVQQVVTGTRTVELQLAMR